MLLNISKLQMRKFNIHFCKETCYCQQQFYIQILTIIQLWSQSQFKIFDNKIMSYYSLNKIFPLQLVFRKSKIENLLNTMKISFNSQKPEINRKEPLNLKASRKIRCFNCGQYIDYQCLNKHQGCSTTPTEIAQPNTSLIKLEIPEFRLNKPNKVQYFSMDEQNSQSYNIKGPIKLINLQEHFVQNKPVPEPLIQYAEIEQVSIIKSSIVVKQQNVQITRHYGSVENKQKQLISTVNLQSQNISKKNNSIYLLCSSQNENNQIYTQQRKSTSNILCGQASKSFSLFNSLQTNNIQLDKSKNECKQRCCQLKLYENKCPCCYRQLQTSDHPKLNTSSSKSNYTIQKKKIFWEIWNEVKHNRNALPKYSFQQAFKHHRFTDKAKWRQAVENLYF